MPPNALYVWVVPTYRHCGAPLAQCVGPVVYPGNLMQSQGIYLGLTLRSVLIAFAQFILILSDSCLCYYRGRSSAPVGSRVGGLR